MPGRLTDVLQERIMKMLVVALALAGIVAAPALAVEVDFEVVDSDGNGMVTMEEVTAAGWEWTEEEFTAADTNGDGSLSAEEFAAATAGD
jgi:EF hand